MRPATQPAGAGLLAGRVAIVTGGAEGIGVAIARAFVRAGAQVVIADCNMEAGTQAAAENGAAFLPVDVADATQSTQVVKETVARFGRLDILVNNAGLARHIDFFDLGVEDWDRINAVNARGTFFFLQAAARVMIAQGGGSVVNISSCAGKGYRTTSSVAYAASKGAIITMTRTCAARLATGNVRVNAICPGPTMTPMLIRMRENMPDAFAQIVADVPLGRASEPEDIANLALFLASDLASTVTGQSWNVDGGLLND
jgi:NAD(P)-dependent dehydrogenase (short-subunit alcohol dehydrogenase family)